DTIHMNFRQPPVGASGFPFSGGFISRLWWSNFPSLAVYIPFWNGVNMLVKTILQLPSLF
ncbi:MAG: hypothetical protein IKS55_12920, partial [Oscillospiraceae bacterium]|nr:hypothetical protein [Oscillospiraceae bacterium]